MVQLTNKREIYDVTNQNSTMKLSGQCTYTDDGRIIDSYFNVYDLQEVSYGNVNYSEMLDDTVNVQYNTVPKTMIESVTDFVNETIESIKTSSKGVKYYDSK